jgi:hypothetical protein
VGLQDIELLEQALARVKEVMTHLNEEKRRTEGQIHIFDIYSEIENCPASVVSSHRRYEEERSVLGLFRGVRVTVPYLLSYWSGI